MSALNGSLGLTEDVLDLILEEAAGDVPYISSRLAEPMFTTIFIGDWQRVASTRLSIVSVCRLWSLVARRHCWASIFLHYRSTVTQLIHALRQYPHNARLIRRITVIFRPDMISSLISLLEIFNETTHTSNLQRQGEMQTEVDRVFLSQSDSVPQLHQLRIIDVKSWDDSSPETLGELLDTISKLDALRALAFHGIDIVPVLPEATNKRKTLSHLTTLETSLPVRGHVRSYEDIQSPVPVAAFSNAFQKRMIIPYISRLIIRDLNYSNFGEDLLEFLAGFKDTLVYLRLEISEPPERISRPSSRSNSINMPSLHHLEISFPYIIPLTEVVNPENLQIITIHSVNRIFRSRPFRGPREQNIDLKQDDLLSDYTLPEVFSSIQNLILNQRKNDNEIEIGKHTSLKNIFLNQLRIHPLQSQDGLDYWNNFANTVNEWVTTFEEEYGVAVLARSVGPQEDSMLRLVNPEIANFRPVAQLIKELFEEWSENIRRMYEYRQSVSNRPQEMDEGGNGGSQETENNGGRKGFRDCVCL